MKKRVLAAMCSFAVCAAAFMGAGNSARASEEFLNGDLTIKGFAKEALYYRTGWDHGESMYHDSRIDMALTSLYFESIYKVKESPELSITWFNGLKWWYEATTSLDDTAHSYMAPNDRRKYQLPTRFEDVLTETYLSFVKGPWDIRVGKQIVIWGQLDVNRVADVVNPLDLRRGVPGVDNWEEIKQGLWMIRSVYRSTLPGNLIFENIYNPGYYQNTKLTYENTHWGAMHQDSQEFNPKSKSPGFMWWQYDKWNKDAPNGWGLNNWELGFRIQGYTCDIDWSLIYWNAKSDGERASPHRLTQYAGNYIYPAILASITGGDVNPQHWDGGKVYRYKRYQTFGGTAQTLIEPLHNSIWRLEWFYENDSPFNLGTNANRMNLYGSTRQEVLGGALQYNDKFEIPWFTRNIGTGSYLQFSLTYFIEHIFDMNPDCITFDRNHRGGDPNQQEITWFILQQMFNANWGLVDIGYYYPMIKKWMNMPCLTYYWPGQHWRTDLGYVQYGGSNNELCGHAYSHGDSVIFRMRYDF